MSAKPSATELNHHTSRERPSSRRAILTSFAGGAAGAAFLAAGWAVNAAAPRAAFEVGSAPAVSSPAKIVIIFGHPEDVEYFEGYYQTKHIPLALSMPKCASIENALGVSETAGEKAAFYRIATLTFNSEANLVACMSSDAGQAAFTDIANFATGGATATIVTRIQAHEGRALREPSVEITIPKHHEQRRMD